MIGSAWFSCSCVDGRPVLPPGRFTATNFVFKPNRPREMQMMHECVMQKLHYRVTNFRCMDCVRPAPGHHGFMPVATNEDMMEGMIRRGGSGRFRHPFGGWVRTGSLLLLMAASSPHAAAASPAGPRHGDPEAGMSGEPRLPAFLGGLGLILLMKRRESIRKKPR